ncbi:MAG TPA: methyltransferase domain-containing protein [Candidatus Binatia bacterium]|nr:methyltransferase domain-containing protein [Candidatus Binatia bacterium]
MLDTPHQRPVPSRILQERYGAGYFHGENSGFAREGYGAVHATWGHWMEFVAREVGPGARWLDVGCAYGFLVEEARAAGFRALGIDASRFALREAATWSRASSDRLACAHAERLPLADASLDVVSAFDLLEHVPEPRAVIAEAARVLRAGGLFLAATPDPLVFDRAEPTHVAERVPSWWVRALEEAGFAVALRFFQAPYNCELIARRGDHPPVVSFDALGVPDPVVRAHGDGRLRVALRSGFGEPTADGSRIVSDGALVYLLNAGREPIEVEIALDLAEPSAVKLALAGRVVARLPAEACGASRDAARAGASDVGGTRARVRVLIAAGGHSLRIAIERGWAHLRSLELRARAGDRDELVSGLPFDLYERYALAAEVASRVVADARTLLDVGGTMGGDAGHLAWTGDFFPGLPVTVVDRRPADVPEHVALATGAPLPFADRAFDVVTALDVLEHVPPAERAAWLAEAWRVTARVLVLGNPFATPGVADADRYLFELIRTRYGYEHGFLAEHLAHGHPDLAATRAFFEARGASVTVLPSGYLPAWALLQTMNAWLSHPEQDGAFPAANRLVNRSVGLASGCEPAYRHVLVVDRAGRDHSARLSDLVAPHGPDLAAVQAALAALAGAAREGR